MLEDILQKQVVEIFKLTKFNYIQNIFKKNKYNIKFKKALNNEKILLSKNKMILFLY